MQIDLYERRANASSPFLRGSGIEIGAGTSPQRLPPGAEALYFDSRNVEELNKHFGAPIHYDVHSLASFETHFQSGADFLIAHHVLEHAPDPIGTLRTWHKLVKHGGTFVLSVPYLALCPDKDRLLPDLEHLVLDHLLGRNGDSFESREHVLSFLCSWVDDAHGLAELSKSQCCRRILSESKRSGHDFHWHAFDHQLFRDVLYAAALLDDCVPTLFYSTEPNEDVLDILAVYTLEPRTVNVIQDQALRVILELHSIAEKVQLAARILLERIPKTIVSS